MGGGEGEVALRWTSKRFRGDVYIFPCDGEPPACRVWKNLHLKACLPYLDC